MTCSGERICQTDAANGAVMAYAGLNEQGFSLRVFGVPKRRVNDFEGIQLITIQKD